MVKFLGVIILLGTIGLAGWFFFLRGGPESAPGEPAGPGTPGEGFSLSGGGSGGSDEGLTDELQGLLEATDAAWQAILDAGDDPTLHAQTATLARDYSTILRATYNRESLAELQARLVERLGPVGEKLFLTGAFYPEDPSGLLLRHSLETGDRFDDLGRKYGLSREHINLMRDRDPKDGNYRKGEIIKLVDTLSHGGFLLVIDKDAFTMDLYIGGVFARRYPVGHGEPGKETPTGRTIICAREYGKEWVDPVTNKKYFPGDPGYIIGKVWLRFQNYGGRQGLGIHGYTGAGPAVGAKVSNGCVRMRNEDAEQLYNVLVPVHPSRDNPGELIQRAPMNVDILD